MPPPKMRYFVTIDGVEETVDVIERPGGGYDVLLQKNPTDDAAEGTPMDVEVTCDDADLTLHVDGRVFDLVIDGEPPVLDVFSSGRRAAVKVESARMRAAASVRARDGAGSGGVVTSPMPGKVVKVLVSEGDEVAVGTPLVVVEAMKMENELVAEAAGSVQKVFVAPGDAVEGGARLIIVG